MNKKTKFKRPSGNSRPSVALNAARIKKLARASARQKKLDAHAQEVKAARKANKGQRQVEEVQRLEKRVTMLNREIEMRETRIKDADERVAVILASESYKKALETAA